VSAHGRTSRDAPGRPWGQPPGGPPQLLWALLVIAAALIGGLAAAALVHTNLVVAVIVAVAAGVIAVAVFRSPGRSEERPGPELDQLPSGRLRPGSPPDGAAPASFARPSASTISPASATVPGPAVPTVPTARPGPAAGPAETAVQLLPLPARPGENTARQAAAQSWWDAAQGAPPPPSAAAQRAPAPDLSTYLASTFIAQCPRCGAFRLDIRQAANGWDFRCESCEYIWTWQPGTPWPPVRVMPGRRRP
jgi:hypothetical protein